MWPKALLELLPHLTRLVPLANRYFQSKAATDDATRLALERKLDEVAASLRSDMTKAAVADPDLVRKLREQNDKVSALAAEVQGIGVSVAAQNEHLARIDRRLQRLLTILIFGLLLLAALLVVAIVRK